MPNGKEGYEMQPNQVSKQTGKWLSENAHSKEENSSQSRIPEWSFSLDDSLLEPLVKFLVSKAESPIPVNFYFIGE